MMSRSLSNEELNIANLLANPKRIKKSVDFSIYGSDSSLYKEVVEEWSINSRRPSRRPAENGDETREEKIQSYIDDMVGNSSFHGVSYIFDKRYSLRRVFWFVITLAFFVTAMEKVYSSTMLFLDFPFSTSIRRRHVEEMKFPAVSFCNLNDIRLSVLNGSKLDHAVKNANKTLLNMLTEEDMKILERTPHELEEMLVECIFNGEPCTHKNFTTFYWKQGDRCYSFNAEKPNQEVMKVKGTGLKRGLMLTINIQHYDYYRDVANAGNGGIRLIIHGQDETPVRIVGMTIPPGFSTHIQIDRKEIINLRPPYKTKCGSLELDYFSGYSMDSCWLEQLTEYVTNKCKCKLIFMPGNKPICDGSGAGCVWYAWENEFDAKRLYHCPLPCKVESFHAQSVSRSIFPSEHYARELQHKIANFTQVFEPEKIKGTTVKQFMRDNLLRVILFYEDLSYELQEQKPSYDLSIFLGDIGGQIGLFIGAGAMSYFELIDGLIMVIYTRFFQFFKPPTK